jgi:predicted RNA binding protein YcfA (HicA-like mRNA interferase family)
MSVKKRIQHLKDKRARGEKIPELRIEEAESIIKDSFEYYENKRGSHIIVKDPRLAKYKKQNPLSTKYGLEGDFTIPVKSGQTVKRCYVEKIIEAIEICELMEGKSEKDNETES